jgi:aminoglycoside phosphotransferase (APT) family kinase protein
MGAGSLVGAPSPQAEDVLSERAGIAEVRWALSGAASRRALRGALQGLLEKGAVLRACRVQRAKLKPGRKLTVHYDAWVRSGATDSKRAVVAIWDRGDGAIDLDAHASTLEAEAVGRGLAAPFRGLCARLPGWNVSVLVSPLDPRLPQLIRLSDPTHVAAMLAGPLAQASDVTYRVSTIRYRPGERHVLRYEPSAGPVAAVFAKLSRREADVARAFDVATCLADRLGACGGGTRAVRPLAAVVEDGAILFPEVGGRPLSELLRGRQDGLTWYLQRAGRALRALHSAPASLAGALAARDFASEVDAVRRASEHICALLPRVGAVIVDALERARVVHDQLPAEAPTLVHGDFKADHLWVAGGGLVVLDFGSCAIGDPALDVGKFLADLRWWSTLSGRGSASMRRAFLEAYGAEEVLRARVYEALFLVLFAAHRVPLYHPAWAERAASLVQRASALLAELL